MKRTIDEAVNKLQVIIDSPPPAKRRSFVRDLDDQRLDEQLEERLSTYNYLVWNAKPDLSARRCAEQGWVVVEKDLLQCVGCKEYLGTQLPSPVLVRPYASCVRAVTRALVHSHEKTCKWRFPVPLAAESSQQAALDGIRRRLFTLQGMKSVLDNVNLVSAEQLNISNDQWKLIDDENEKLAVLAICGWQYRNDDVLHCSFCQRNLGVWLFCAEEKALDPLRQHHSWCHLLKSESDTFTWKAELQLATTFATNSPHSNVTSDFVTAKNILNDAIAAVEMDLQEEKGMDLQEKGMDLQEEKGMDPQEKGMDLQEEKGMDSNGQIDGQVDS